MSAEAAEFVVAHLLHLIVGACLVWFLWKAIRMSVRAEAVCPLTEADEVTPP